MKRIGVLLNAAETNADYQALVTAFTQVLRKQGWIEGQNVAIDYRWNQGDAERAQLYASELVALKPDAILASSTRNLAALQRVTSTIPIVFVQVSDPIRQKFVPNLARPGGNITGFTAFEFSIGGKWLQLLKDVAPRVTHAALIFNPDAAPQVEQFVRSGEDAARALGVQLIAIHVGNVAGIGQAFETVAAQPNGGVIIPTDAFLTVHRGLAIELAARYRLPAIYPQRYFVTSGGLISYGFNDFDPWLGAATYVDRILKGEKPGDLPVQTPTKFDLIVNLKTARALDLTISEAFLLAADEVIE